jgi:hypothetical protein
MVKEEKSGDRIFYTCEVCNLAYEERVWAEKCEEFCSTYNACSLEITSHVIKKPDGKNHLSNSNT